MLRSPRLTNAARSPRGTEPEGQNVEALQPPVIPS